MLLLHIDWRVGGRNRINLNLVVSNIWHSVDRKLGQREHAEARCQERYKDHEPALVDREVEDF